MTFGELVKDVRAFLIDRGAVTELTDKEYAQFASAGVRLIRELCPQSQLTGDGRATAAYAVVDAGEPSEALCIGDTYYHALVDYMMYRYYDRDSGDSRDRVQSKQYWSHFLQALDSGVR